MEKKMECPLCDKKYSSHASLLNHKRLYHDIDNKKKLFFRKNTEDNSYHCKYCDKKYSTRGSRWVHEKKCSLENSNDEMGKILEENEKISKENEIVKEEITEKNKKIMKQADQIIKLQNKIIKSNRLDTKTFKAINKILMNRSYMNNSQNINSLNTIHNNIQQICNIGNEELANVLTMQQKKEIMNSRLLALEKIVEITHCGHYNQFKNIIITNLKDNFAYKYNISKGYFITVEKNELLDNVITLRLTDIEEIYDELKDAKKIDDKTKKIIQSFLDKCNSDEPYIDENETKYPNFKSYKQNSIKILLYNNQDKITKDIALLSSDPNDNSESERIQDIIQ